MFQGSDSEESIHHQKIYDDCNGNEEINENIQLEPPIVIKVIHKLLKIIKVDGCKGRRI